MYYVVDPTTGSRYGPADVATLNLWAREGRITAASQLEDAATGQLVTVGRVPGLILPNPENAPPSGSREPYANSNYQRPYGSTFTNPPSPYGYDPSVEQSLTNAWISIVAGLFCGCPILHIVALINAKRARDAGHPTGNTAYIIALVLLCLYGVAIVAYVVAILALSAGLR